MWACIGLGMLRLSVICIYGLIRAAILAPEKIQQTDSFPDLLSLIIAFNDGRSLPASWPSTDGQEHSIRADIC